MPPNTASYIHGDDEVSCTIIKRGKKNTRIRLDDGSKKLVPTEDVLPTSSEPEKDLPMRVVPTVALENFYREMRGMTGPKGEKFQKLCERLGERHGPAGGDFLVELFLRSISHAAFYDNAGEAFHPDERPKREDTKGFANNFVDKLYKRETMKYAGLTLKYVDYEIAPLRTTRSCNERGKLATKSGAGGMDLLLASLGDGYYIPAIGEIKASSDPVGATFALVQSLMYAAQLATQNQFTRIQEHYPKIYGGLITEEPELDVFLIFEKDYPFVADDLEFAKSLAKVLKKQLPELRRIEFLSAWVEGDDIKCIAL